MNRKAPSLRKRLTVILLGCGGAAVIALLGWSGRRMYEGRQLRMLLPSPPDVSAFPPGLAAALESARREALKPAASIAGLAELGRLYQANGLLDPAAKCWKILLNRASGDGRWSYFLADIARTSGDDQSMASWLKKTVETTPTYSTAWLKLADWELKTGQMEQAERDYRRRLELVPGDPYARLGLARIALARRQRRDARRSLESLVRNYPTFYSANNLLEEILEENGDRKGATTQRKLARKGLRFREADDPWLDELKGRCFDVTQLSVWASIELSTNHGDHGIALLERAIRVAPGNPTGYTDLGQVYLQLRNPSGAMSVFKKATTLPGASADAYAGLSEAYRDLGQPEKAAAAVRRGLERLPQDANLETALGNSLRAAGQLDGAIRAYRRAIELAPNVAETHFNLGSVLLQQNDIHGAELSLERALDLDPDYPRALVALGRLSLASGKLETAGRCAHALYASNPQMPEAKELMGWWCLESGMAAAKDNRSQQAEQLLRDGMAANPSLPELYARLGLLYGQEGRLAEALSMLEQYHELAPTEPMSFLFLGQAYMHLGKSDEARRFLSDAYELARRRGNAAVASMCSRFLERLGPPAKSQ